MKDSTRIILVIICIVLVIFLISVLTWGILFRENIFEGDLRMVKEEEYLLEDIKKIIVTTPRADVQVFRTDEDKIKIIEKASRKVKEKDLFLSSIKDDTLEITDQRRNFCFGFCFLPSIVYEIYIPNSYQKQITIKTTSGDIEIDALNSTSIQINSVSGDIDSRTIEGKETKIKTTSGDIELGWINGEIEVVSVSGDVELDYFSPLGNSNIKTTSGEIEVMLDKNASVKMHADSVSGDIRFPNSESILGSGEHSISFKTVSGNIKVRVTAER